MKKNAGYDLAQSVYAKGWCSHNIRITILGKLEEE